MPFAGPTFYVCSSAEFSVEYPPLFFLPLRSDPISVPMAWSAELPVVQFSVGLGVPILHVGVLCYSAL